MEKSFSAEVDQKTFDWLCDCFCPEDPLLVNIRLRAEHRGLPPIHVGRFDGLHLEVLARACNARKIVEVGTLAGYSGIHLLRGMPADGKLFTFEYSAAYAEVAKESFREAGFETQVELHIGAALDLLPTLEANGPFDLVFIDADKENYPNYLSWAEKNLRTGGLVIADNALAFGMLALPSCDPPKDQKTAEAIRTFNREIVKSGHFRATFLPTGEGMVVGVKI